MNKKFLNEVRRMQQLAGMNPIDHNFVPIESVRLFCEDKITEQEFLAELNSELLEENVLEWIKTNIIDKVENYINSFLLQVYSIGWNILNKIKTFFGWIFGLITKFAKKYPILFKIIIISLIILVLICFFACCAKAASQGQPVTHDQINVAIGYLETISKLDYNVKNEETFHRAMKVLINMKGYHEPIKFDFYGKEVSNVVDFALQKAKEIQQQSQQGSVDTQFDYAQLLNKGKEIVDIGIKEVNISDENHHVLTIVKKAGEQITTQTNVYPGKNSFTGDEFQFGYERTPDN